MGVFLFIGDQKTTPGACLRGFVQTCRLSVSDLGFTFLVTLIPILDRATS